MPPLILIERELVQVAFLQIHGGDGVFAGASRKSDRSFIGAFLPDLFSVIIRIFPKSLELCRQVTIRVDFLCKCVHRSARLFSPANFELRITTCLVF